MFVLATPQLQSSQAAVVSRAAVLRVAEDYSCHTNFAGFVLAGNYSAAGTDAGAVVAAANAMVSVVAGGTVILHCRLTGFTAIPWELTQ
jgi:hypothetical protein